MPRAEAITKCLNKYFTTPELNESLDVRGHFCYKNKDITVYDCLFTVRFIKDGYLQECSNVNEPRILCKESEITE